MIRRERFSSSSDPYWTLNAEGRKLVNQRATERYSALRLRASMLFYARFLSPSARDRENFEQFLEQNKRRIRIEESKKVLKYAAYMWEKKHGRRKKFSKDSFEKVKGFKYRPID